MRAVAGQVQGRHGAGAGQARSRCRTGTEQAQDRCQQLKVSGISAVPNVAIHSLSYTRVGKRLTY